jgi:tetratricopeptide (TPR) repeat protein
VKSRSVFLSSLIALGACASAPGRALPPATLEEAERELLLGNELRAAQVAERVALSQSAGSREWARANLLACGCRLKLGQAEQVLPRLQRLAASRPEPRLLARGLDLLSETHLALGQHAPSLAALESIRDLPRSAVDEALKADEFLFKLGCARQRGGRPESAIDALRQLVERHPTSVRAVDAALRIAVRGFGVRVGEAYPAGEERLPPPSANGHTCRYVRVDVRGRPSVLIAVISQLPTYEEALRLSRQIGRGGQRAEPLP